MRALCSKGVGVTRTKFSRRNQTGRYAMSAKTQIPDIRSVTASASLPRGDRRATKGFTTRSVRDHGVDAICFDGLYQAVRSRI